MHINNTDQARERWLLRTKGKQPARKWPLVKRVPKAPGSLELVLGKWVEHGERP